MTAIGCNASTLRCMQVAEGLGFGQSLPAYLGKICLHASLRHSFPMTTGSVRRTFTQFLPRLAAGLRVTGVSRATVEISRVAQFVVPPRTSVPQTV